MDGMEWADACVLVLPCGRSAHLEAGWFAGKGKPVFVLTFDGEEPELMAKMCHGVYDGWLPFVMALREYRKEKVL
jgi:nucleoside 2-deoxyribosyltransferase